jgi:hypothetical protein
MSLALLPHDSCRFEWFAGNSGSTNSAADTARFWLYGSSMRDSFTHKFLLTLFAALAAAGLLYFYRHTVITAIHETSDEGWKEMDTARAKAKHH